MIDSQICGDASVLDGAMGDENGVEHPGISEWQNRRGTEVNTLLWYHEEYLVVLAQRSNYCCSRARIALRRVAG